MFVQTWQDAILQTITLLSLLVIVGAMAAKLYGKIRGAWQNRRRSVDVTLQQMYGDVHVTPPDTTGYASARNAKQQQRKP
jgi:hypothetical protein